MTQQQILEIHAAVQSARLVGSRDALLVGIDAGFVARLPSAANRSDQILLDLDAMNTTGALANGTVPLEFWLQNAAALARPRTEALLFERALRESRLPPPAVLSVPSKVNLQPRVPAAPVAEGRPIPRAAPPHAAAMRDAAKTAPSAPSSWWMPYFAWAGSAAVLVGTISAVSRATSQGVGLLEDSNPTHALPLEATALGLVLAGLWAMERSARRPIAFALAALSAGCLAWLVFTEVGSLALAMGSGMSRYGEIRRDGLHAMVESHLGWLMGLVIGAGLQWWVLGRTPTATTPIGAPPPRR
jgi:hypothetical protein